MAFRFIGEDPIETQVEAALQALADGQSVAALERRVVDFKEEPARRNGHVILPGQLENDEAARYLASEAACFGNTVGGGALIVGIANSGDRIGTELDAEWLRHRIWELTERKLTVDVTPIDFEGARLLIIRIPQSFEMIRFNGQVRWRVDDNCVAVDATTWASSRLTSLGHDWSRESSSYTVDDVSAVAMQIARRYAVSAIATPPLDDLASASDQDLLRRLDVVDNTGHLRNAGALLFVKTPEPALDYIRREVAGGDSLLRVRQEGPLLEQLNEVERAANSYNRTIHLKGEGFAVGQVTALPPGAIREAIVNGVTHRDWQTDTPTTVEHLGDSLVVTSPGGFVGGVDAGNIITHPSAPRYRLLATIMERLQLAEQEGVGVDRMMRDMLALGHERVEIAEARGPVVQTALVGGDPDEEWVRFLSVLIPSGSRSDLNILLLLDLLIHRGWVDVDQAAPVLQRLEAETRASIGRLLRMTWRGEPVIALVDGVPVSDPDAWHFTPPVREHLVRRMPQFGDGRGRRRVVEDWATCRGRVSSTEVGSITGLSVVSAGTLLKEMAEDGVLEGSSPSGRGRGYFYRPA